jgi:hypothetical protein
MGNGKRNDAIWAIDNTNPRAEFVLCALCVAKSLATGNFHYGFLIHRFSQIGANFLNLSTEISAICEKDDAK